MSFVFQTLEQYLGSDGTVSLKVLKQFIFIQKKYKILFNDTMFT